MQRSQALGLAMLPSFIVGADIRSGALSVVDIGRQVEPEFLFVAHPEGGKVSAKRRALVECLRGMSGDPPYCGGACLMLSGMPRDVELGFSLSAPI